MASPRFALEMLALSAIAAASCSDNDPGPAPSDAGARTPDAGQAGKPDAARDAGTLDSGSSQRPKVGDVCDAGSALGPTCAAARIDWQTSCKPRYEDTQCYLPTDGSPCLPASDPKLVDNLVDFITSAGFRAEFVIADAPGVEVPASCDALIDCCSQLPDNYVRVSCYDQVDNPKNLPCSGSWSPSRLQPNLSCPAPDADAGTRAGPRPSLCCYRTCGYMVDT